MNVQSSKPAAADIDQVKCVLVGAPSQPTFEATPGLKYATELAAGHGACLSLFVLPPAAAAWPTTVGSGPVWRKRESDQLRRQATLVSKGAGRLVAKAGVDLVSECATSPFEPRDARFVQLARLHDVTVLDAATTDVVGRIAVEDVLFDSGRPLITIPAHGGATAPRRIVIAWDGSARAARAVKDALPLLEAAELVVALTIAGEKDLSRMAPGADLATYLARHGIEDCKLATLTARRADVGARLRLFVAEEEIDMIVMGAFVHSRFREAVLGGVTRSMLDETPVPLFMSH
jgi:nucleotide-binding universal stress UspA family protein